MQIGYGIYDFSAFCQNAICAVVSYIRISVAPYNGIQRQIVHAFNVAVNACLA